MKFNEIYLAVNKELKEVESELKTITENLSDNSLIKEVFTYFFSSSGKYIRSTLTLLSAKAINNQLPESVNHQLIQLCVGIELIHNASLIHDDIIDEDLIRRSQLALNKVYGNKIAILAGDALYSRAFFIFSDKLPQNFSKAIGKVTEAMSVSEILNARMTALNRETYLKIVEKKTALFMSRCCGLGATLAYSNEEDISMLSNYGKNLGIAYQILDDYIDKDPVARKNITIDEAFKFAYNAKDSIKNIKSSIYTESLIKLVDYVLDSYTE
ncbi:polyprenyl synthetase family protein [Clostridium sp.]|uniref:polyprenyl synthetase family protein n=1 Tax=Clostridium sp. TaxID=1506 RepID=UPI0025892ADF|nr:polyprenyl synthetase family protein [Clostridium sp.]MDF2505927.1 putative polyprenyl synthetase [Clostridium sp.]